jgi:hypothetical protein
MPPIAIIFEPCVPVSRNVLIARGVLAGFRGQWPVMNFAVAGFACGVQNFTYRVYHFLMLQTALCPKCRSALLYVTALPHPNAPEMRKTTFVCRSCNRTWTYPLTAELAELYAAEAALLEIGA